MTPTQIRARIVTALRPLGYTVSDRVREDGRLKAWMRRTHRRTSAGREAGRVAEAIAGSGLSVTGRRAAYSGEYRVWGPRYDVTVNQEADSGNLGGIFVEVSRT